MWMDLKSNSGKITKKMINRHKRSEDENTCSHHTLSHHRKSHKKLEKLNARTELKKSKIIIDDLRSIVNEIPYQIKIDSLMNYANIMVNSFNACDYELMLSTLHKYRTPSTTSHITVWVGDQPTQVTLVGIEEVAVHLWGRMNEMPDSICTIEDVQLTPSDDETYILTFRYTVTGTQYLPVGTVQHVYESISNSSSELRAESTQQQATELQKIKKKDFENLSGGQLDEVSVPSMNLAQTDSPARMMMDVECDAVSELAFDANIRVSNDLALFDSAIIAEDPDLLDLLDSFIKEYDNDSVLLPTNDDLSSLPPSTPLPPPTSTSTSVNPRKNAMKNLSKGWSSKSYDSVLTKPVLIHDPFPKVPIPTSTDGSNKRSRTSNLKSLSKSHVSNSHDSVFSERTTSSYHTSYGEYYGDSHTSYGDGQSDSGSTVVSTTTTTSVPHHMATPLSAVSLFKYHASQTGALGITTSSAVGTGLMHDDHILLSDEGRHRIEHVFNCTQPTEHYLSTVIATDPTSQSIIRSNHHKLFPPHPSPLHHPPHPSHSSKPPHPLTKARSNRSNLDESNHSQSSLSQSLQSIQIEDQPFHLEGAAADRRLDCLPNPNGYESDDSIDTHATNGSFYALRPSSASFIGPMPSLDAAMPVKLQYNGVFKVEIDSHYYITTTTYTVKPIVYPLPVQH